MRRPVDDRASGAELPATYGTGHNASYSMLAPEASICPIGRE